MADGLAVLWHFAHIPDCSGICLAESGDAIALEELRADDSPREIGEATDVAGGQDGPMDTAVPQSIWVQITPDDPHTAVDESGLGVIGPIGTTLYCANNSDVPCGASFQPGEQLQIGITASATSENDISVTATDITVTQYGVCPGET